MTFTIHLSDEHARALQAKAVAEGLSPEAWLEKLASVESSAEQHPMQAVADMIVARMRDVPPEIMASMPADGASQHDHYIYGWPKKPE